MTRETKASRVPSGDHTGALTPGLLLAMAFMVGTGRGAESGVLAASLAEQGFPVPEGMDEIWRTQQTVKELKSNDESARVFLPAGKPPQLGEVFRNPDLAESLHRTR